MGYMQGVSEQLKVFLYSFGLGFLLGILYDIFRTLRMIFSFGKVLTFIQDFLYVIICAFLTFSFALVLNDGKIMFYIFFGEVMGWLIYYFTFGTLALRVSSAVVKGVRLTFFTIIKLFRKPINFVIRKIKKITNKINTKTKINSKKVVKNTKFLLKKREGMLYTLNRIVYLCGKYPKNPKRKHKNVSSAEKKEKDI